MKPETQVLNLKIRIMKVLKFILLVVLSVSVCSMGFGQEIEVSKELFSEVMNGQQKKLSFVEAKVHPNPANEYLQLELDHDQTSSSIPYEIFDIMGKKVTGGKLQKKQINITNLQPGIYLLELNTDKGIQIAKFVKE